MKSALIQIPEKIEKLLKDYQEDITQAWANCGEEPLTISFGAKIGVVRGKNMCEVSISFTKEKVKDMISFEWNDHQQKLFKTVEGKSVTLGAKT